MITWWPCARPRSAGNRRQRCRGGGLVCRGTRSPIRRPVDQWAAGQPVLTQNLAAFPRLESARSCGDDESRNLAAAKAYQREKFERWREEQHAQNVATDLEQLRILYLIFDRKAGVSADDLIKAIDDYVQQFAARKKRPESPSNLWPRARMTRAESDD
jgi:hypothetical protein